MPLQHSVSVRNGMLDAIETAMGTSAKFRIYTGAIPADCATAASGTLLVDIACPLDFMAAASGGTKALSGSWTASASATGTAGYYRMYDSTATTCHEQGLVFQQVAIATNALTAANGNVLNFASTTGVSVGMLVAGTGVVAGSSVVAVTATTVTLSRTSTAGVANATSITFTGDVTLDNVSINSGQTVNITAKTYTAPGA